MNVHLGLSHLHINFHDQIHLTLVVTKKTNFLTIINVQMQPKYSRRLESQYRRQQQPPLLLHMRCLALVLESTGSNKAGTRPEDGSGRLMGAILVLINAAQMRLH